MNSRRLRGDEGEDRAADHLRQIGYTIITRNAHSRRGEIDIVALDGDLLVFVEVKHRRDGSAAEAITPSKASRLRDAARDYLINVGEPDRSFRFDLIAVGPDTLDHHLAILRD
jgi:putative endonuclease